MEFEGRPHLEILVEVWVNLCLVLRSRLCQDCSVPGGGGGGGVIVVTLAAASVAAHINNVQKMSGTTAYSEGTLSWRYWQGWIALFSGWHTGSPGWSRACFVFHQTSHWRINYTRSIPDWLPTLAFEAVGQYNLVGRITLCLPRQREMSSCMLLGECLDLPGGRFRPTSNDVFFCHIQT